ncbi:MAG: iron-containing redox enzyme family protein [Armatimonadota bacterium]
MATRAEQIRSIVDRFDLNRHPFYTAWREGTLPMEMLSRYAVEYGELVGTIPAAWEALGSREYAAEERYHHSLWEKFAAEVHSGTEEPWTGAGETPLSVTARCLFGDARPEALGALYAFEVQQPVTSRVKLDGLKDHYRLGVEAQEYFEEHADKWHEVEDLDRELNSLTDAEFERAKTAAAVMAGAMWLGLDRIWYSGADLPSAPTARA